MSEIITISENATIILVRKNTKSCMSRLQIQDEHYKTIHTFLFCTTTRGLIRGEQNKKRTFQI